MAVMAQLDALLVREPAVSQSQIAFCYGGNIWVMPKSGGLASRLTSGPGPEMFPRFSPDGKFLAFTGNYDGNEDVYVIPSSGGEVRRVTHHPASERVVGWFPDGRSILVASAMESPVNRYSQLYKVSVDGGLPEKLPVPYGEFGAISEDGALLAYCPNSEDLRTWKRYRGGDVSRIWLFNLKEKTGKQVGDEMASYSQPMWHGSTLYLLSDRGANERYNIWAYEMKSGAWREVTHFSDFDVHFPSIGPEEMVFEAGGQLYIMSLESEKISPVKAEVITDAATLRPQSKKVVRELRGWDPSPSAKRVAFEARGEIFTVPAEHGPTLNLTRSSGVAERFPAWSPDGKWIAYWSDKTGEYELAVRLADGSGQERTVTKLGPGYRYNIFWSPDSKTVAFVDQAMNVELCDIATGAVTKIDKGLWLYDEVQDKGHESLMGFTFSWSSDSRYVAWAREVDNRMGAIFIRDTKSGKTSQVTAGFYNDCSPVFDPDGKYLFYLTHRTFDPLYSDLDATWIYADGTQIAAVPLDASVQSPLAPRNDAEEAKKSEDSKPGADKKEGADENKAPVAVKIDVEGFESRAVLLPPKAGNYANLAAAPGKILYLRMPCSGAAEDARMPVVYYDLKEREEKTVLDDAKGFAVTANGEKLLVSHGDDFSIVDVAPDQKLDKKLDLSGLEMTVDPRAEWKQIFNDAWRFERDFFYDPNMHGVDWNLMRKRYGALIGQCVTRWDVNFVLGELIGEINSSHTYRGGGDSPKPPERPVGLLGCDFRLENGAFRITKIYAGAQWNVAVRSPLNEPGALVKEGSYLLAVNGSPLDPKADPWAAFEGLAGKTAELAVNDKPAMEGARKVLVKTLNEEEDARLRNLAWIESNRLKVEKESNGRLGYIYVPDTMPEGQNELYRQFMGQITKEGLVIDERFNSGGQIPDRFIELLNRPILNYWHVRDGRDWQWPEYSHAGPKVMLINGWSGSGGDCFPYYFREAKLGPLVGMRTWGGLIGLSGSPSLIDGGVVTVPTFSFYTPLGKWAVEGHGVDPDVKVVDDPALMQNGGDPQLDRAIAEALRLLKEHPPVSPRPPQNPDRSQKQ
ncbi:MAG: PD40 domain-containing protein [Acidobacteria bacterium]|nr:PD40 domain-containing protein [Acidobacteriota bacterium]